MKLNTIIILILLIFNSNMEYPIKEELVKIFDGLPIEKNVEEIINESNIEFRYWRIPIPLSGGDYTENWQSELKEYKYLKHHNGQIILTIIKEFSGDVNCNEISIKLQYNSYELMEKDYKTLKSMFIEKGVVLEESSILGKLLPAKFKNVIVDIETENSESKFSFSTTSGSGMSDYRMTLVFEKCIE